MSSYKVVHLAFPDKDAEVHIGKGVLADIASMSKDRFVGTKVLFVSDETCGPVYGELSKKRFEELEYQVFEIQFKANEDIKTLDNIKEIWEKLKFEHFSREDIIVAIGGSTILELVGFAASTYMHGMRYIQVPTTLMSMADTCVGGKSNIEFSNKQNVLGTFYQADLVCCDTRCLHTCNDEEWQNGFASLVRCAIVAPRRSFYEWLRSHASSLQNKDDFTLRDAIYMSLDCKADLVMKDFSDTTDVQACFKMGDSFASALLSTDAAKDLSCGLALAEALRFSSKLAVEVLGTPIDFITRLEELLTLFGLKEQGFSSTPENIFYALTSQENSSVESFQFILPRDFNEWDCVKVSDELVYEHVDAWCTYKEQLLNQ